MPWWVEGFEPIENLLFKFQGLLIVPEGGVDDGQIALGREDFRMPGWMEGLAPPEDLLE